MHHMTDLQWWLFFLTNWSTAVAYTYIPLHLYLARSVAGDFGKIDTRLFERFVFACGVHHFFHPVAMWFGLWWANIGVDTTMAIVSIWAAFVLWKANKVNG